METPQSLHWRLVVLLLFPVGCISSNRTEPSCTESELSLLQLTSSVSIKSPRVQLGAAPDATLKKPRHQWKLDKTARLNEVLVVPSLKLIFCFIPKNACTQFNRLMNALNGIDMMWDGEICSDRDPNYKSGMYNNFTAENLEDALNDPSWTKATFLRDPLQRLVSAYLSKCVEPRECGGCEGLENAGSPKPDIAELADVLPYSRDAHFLQQSSLCGGLSKNIGAYDYVGHITEDGNDVSKQVTEMLELAIKRKDLNAQSSTSSTLDQVSEHEPEEAALQEEAALTSSDALQEEALAPFGSTLSEQDARILELGRQYFPATGPDPNDPHIHLHQNVSALLHDTFALQKVLTHYEKDYDELPGLSRPAWAHRVSSYYEVFKLFQPRPHWLEEGGSV